MGLRKKIAKNKGPQIAKWMQKKAATFRKNEALAIHNIRKEHLEIKGYILQRLVTNTMYVLTYTFGFRKAQFDRLNAGMDYMSDIVAETRDFSAWDCQQGLLEECKYDFKKREPIKIDLENWLKAESEKEVDMLISYRNIYDCYATNGAIKINEPWESMVMWVLRTEFGFGRKRLERFQNKMSALWAVPPDEMHIMAQQLSEKLKVNNLKIGTKRIHLPILKRDEVAA